MAVNGCCLTVTAPRARSFEVQAGPETLARTNLGSKGAGDPVNLERALKVGDRLGGHFVQGHIDTTAVLRDRRQEGEWEFLAFEIDPDWTPAPGLEGIDRGRRREPDPGRRRVGLPSRSCSFPTRWP